MIRAIYRSPEGQITTDITAEAAWQRLQASSGGLLWVDIRDEPFASAEGLLLKTFGFHPLAADDALTESHVPKLDDWGDYIYVTLHSVTKHVERWEQLDTVEADLFVGRGYVVSYQSRPVAGIERVWQMVQRDERHLSRGAEHILYLLSDELVADFFPIVNDIDDEIDQLENELLESPESVEMDRLFGLKRTLVQLRRTVAPLREVLNRLSRNGYAVLRPESAMFFRDVYDHLVRLYDLIESLRDLLTSTLDMYLSVINNRMNQIMKVLTVVSTLLIPLTFITGFFGMNFFAPSVDLAPWTGHLALVLTLVGLVATPVGMYLWMRQRAWM
jgi:magnesium transporter